MAEILTTSPRDVVLECASLSTNECADLVSFLESQPEIDEVWRIMFATDAIPDRNTLSLLIRHVEFVVTVARDAKEVVGAVSAALLVTRKIKNWLENRTPEGQRLKANVILSRF
jgi:hypothetical protein